MDIDNITNIKSSIINRNIIHRHPFNSVFIRLLAEKSPAMLPKHKGYLFIFESFALN